MQNLAKTGDYEVRITVREGNGEGKQEEVVIGFNVEMGVDVDS